MSKFRKIAVAIILIELMVIVLCNIFYATKISDYSGRLYRVEAGRIAQELKAFPAQDIDLSAYETIVAVTEFNAGEVCSHDYVVEQVNGQLYRIAYVSNEEYGKIWIFNICLAFMLVVTIAVFWYIWRKVLQPFHKMSDLTYELAKGNLSTPIKAEKSKLFGKFLWGMDMLRETLENGKEKELELLKEKKTLILSLSHDIKTPLSAIDLYTKALSENLYDTEEKRAEALRGIARNVQEIKGYVNEIATASREDFLNLEVREGEFYLQQMMRVVETYYKDKLSVLHTHFDIEPVDNCLLQGDMERVIETLQNILENAIKYGDGKYIRIFTSEEEDCRLIHVKNSGCGLKTEELSHIFDSFYRGSNSQNIKGSGLGLYIAKNLMRKMGGDVYAKPEDDSFTVSVVIRKA